MNRTSTTALPREHIRALNQGAIINTIHRRGRVSRTELAAELQLSPAAITGITGNFIDQGLVFESRQGTSSTVGRKPILLEINYDYAFVLGAKVSPSAVTTVLTNLKAEAIDSRTHPLEKHDLATVLATIEQATNDLRSGARIPPAKLAGLGVNLPGIVEHHTGRVRYAPFLDWYDVPFSDLLAVRVQLPILVENDVNALAAAEAWFGTGVRHDSFLVVTLGRGVGLGIVIDGRVYRGPHGGAGEFGHTIISPPFENTSPGTVESFLSDDALLAQAHRRIPDFPDEARPEDLTRYAQAHHPEALTILQDAGTMLGLALSHLVNIFAPQLIVLSGEGVRNAAFLLPHAQGALKQYAFGDLAERLEIVLGAWGDDAWARGAAGLAASRFLAEYPTLVGGEN